MEKCSWWKESKCKGPEAGEWLVMNKVVCVAGVEIRPAKQGLVDMERRWKPLGGYKLLSLHDRDNRSSCTHAPPTIFSLSSVLSPSYRCLDQGLLRKSLRGNREANWIVLERTWSDHGQMWTLEGTTGGHGTEGGWEGILRKVFGEEQCSGSRHWNEGNFRKKILEWSTVCHATWSFLCCSSKRLFTLSLKAFLELDSQGLRWNTLLRPAPWWPSFLQVSFLFTVSKKWLMN